MSNNSSSSHSQWVLDGVQSYKYLEHIFDGYVFPVLFVVGFAGTSIVCVTYYLKQYRQHIESDRVAVERDADENEHTIGRDGVRRSGLYTVLVAGKNRVAVWRFRHETSVQMLSQRPYARHDQLFQCGECNGWRRH